MTLASASSMDKDFTLTAATLMLQEGWREHRKKCLEKGITEVVYDRGGFVYHGRVQLSLRVPARPV